MPAELVQTFRAMAYNNGWANGRLLTACAGLTEAEFEAPRTGFFPSLQQTLNHILIVDWFYVDGLEGGTLGPKAWENRVPCATVQLLQAAQRLADQRLIRFCDGLNAQALDSTASFHRGARIQRERVDRILMHLFQHQIHHRGQAHAMLSATSVKPPQLDEFYSFSEAPLREPEFSALGWTEQLIWGTDQGGPN